VRWRHYEVFNADISPIRPYVMNGRISLLTNLSRRASARLNSGAEDEHFDPFLAPD
jgi:hypothetical protein